jgi:hypothetical protein
MNKLIVSRLWQVTDRGNMVLENEHIRVSYNPVTGAITANPVVNMAQAIAGSFNGESEPQEETALLDRDSGIWRILLGDFRVPYQEAYPDWDKCLAVYEKYKGEYRSRWSTDEL